MPTVNVINIKGEEVGKMELSDAVFGITPNTTAMHAVVVNYLANQRQGTQSTKTRAEVSGGGKKPWRQKGTGRARQGSTRAIQWTHGGVAFAPKPRTYRYTINRKLKRLALVSALSAKFAGNELVVIDNITVETPKTKPFASFLKAVGADGKALVLTSAADRNTALSARNIPGVKTSMASLVNTYDVLNCGKLVLDKASLNIIGEVFM